MRKYLDFCVIIIIFSLGILVGRYLFPHVVIKEIPKQKTVTIQEKTQVQTIIKYIPKKIDSQTGKKEKTDIQLDTKSNINVLVNGKNFEFTPLNSENYKFENGKLLMEQQTTLDLNITLPKPERKIELGYYTGLNSNSQLSFGGTLLIPRQESGSQIFMGGLNYDYNKNKIGLDARYSITW